jgi:hypothetical protein
VPGVSKNQSDRSVWAEGNRAERYRDHASRIQQLAAQERQPRVRERLLELAGQYSELAERVAGQKKPTPPG